MNCARSGLYHHAYYCTCSAVCDHCGAPAWDLCACVKCVTCEDVRVQDEGERCPECQADYWESQRDTYYDNLAKEND